MDGTTQAQVISQDGVLYWDIGGRLLPVMAGGDGEGGAPASLTVEPGDVSKQEGAPASAPKAESQEKPSQPAKAKERGPSPWAKDLTDRGLDDPRFDEYLREVWQPRSTQMEQRLSDWTNLFGDDIERAQIMAALADALDADPVSAYEDFGRMLREGNLIPGLDDGTNGEAEFNGDEEYGDDGDTYEGDPGQDDPVRAWVMERMQQEQEAQQQEAYSALLSDLEAKMPGFDADLFNELLVAYEGDVDAALGRYSKYHKAPADPATPPDAPPLGESPAPSPKPVSRPQGIAGAVAEFMSEDAARRKGVG